MYYKYEITYVWKCSLKKVTKIFDNEVTSPKHRNLLARTIQQKLSTEIWVYCGISLYEDPYVKNSGKLLIFDILWIICNKLEKYRKWLRKGPLEKDLIFFYTEW